MITTLSTDDYEQSKDVFECTVQLAQNLELCFSPITETNLQSIEVLKIAVNLCNLLEPTKNDILGRNTKHIIEALQKLITGIFMISLESHLDEDFGIYCLNNLKCWFGNRYTGTRKVILTQSKYHEDPIHQNLQQFCPEVLEYSKNFELKSQLKS